MCKDRLFTRYKQHQLFDITKHELLPLTVNNKKYLVYNNVNLSVFINDHCNAECKFCVAQLRYFNDGVDYIKPAISNDIEYFDRLYTMLETVKTIRPSVSLTGGEPTLDPKLPVILNILDEYRVRKRTLTTNGSGLLNKVKHSNDTILDRLINYKLKHLNISRAHYDEETNFKIMKLKDSYFSNNDLKKVVEIAKANNIRPRLSCVLINNYVDCIDEMIKYMDWAKSIGVDNVVFRQLMGYDETTVKPGEIAEFCKQNRVKLIPIWEEIDNRDDFTFSNNVLGYYYYVEVFKYKGIDMVSEMADLKLIDREKEKSLIQTGGIPVIYEMVFHPNGNLCGSWREWKEIILG
ncbi:MAG: radical SAM protein [Cyanobacteriota bacterium]